VEPRIYLVVGAAFTGKTTFALGEDPEDEVDYFELEPGGWRRAHVGIKHPDRITIHRHRIPKTDLDDLGEVVIGAKGGVAPKPAHHLTGWVDIYNTIVTEYLDGLNNGKARPVIDTSTRLWLIIRQAWQEQMQNATGNVLASMEQLKYTATNARMAQFVERAEDSNKPLVLIAHEDRDFNSGELKQDGYKDLPGMADVTLRFTLENNRPVAEIWKMGEGGPDMLHRKIVQPTIEKVNTLLEGAAKVRALGMSLPDDNDELLELAAGL
jgi:hypothetical protein